MLIMFALIMFMEVRIRKVLQSAARCVRISEPRFLRVRMVGIAQLVRALDCGSRGRGFESLYPPQY